MRILLVNDDYPPEGQSSVAHVTQDLAQTYARKGHTVLVLTSHRKEVSGEIVRRDGVVSLPVSYRRSLRHYRMIRMRNVSHMVEREVAAFAPDAVHVHNVHLWLTFDTLRIARAYCDTVCITLHDVMSFAYGRLATRRFLDTRGEDASLRLADHLAEARLEYNPLRNILIRRKMRYATHIVSPSIALKKAALVNGIPVTDVIPHGIDLERWRPLDGALAKEALGVGGRRTILFGGRLNADKGVREVLAAFRTVLSDTPEALLLVIGDERKWQRFMADAKDLESHIRCLGWRPRETLPDIFAAADVVTTPSLCLDVFLLMNTEAMAMAKPVVGTIFGGTPEIIVDGKTGFTLDPRDTDAYAKKMAMLLTDTSLAKHMGDAGRSRVEKEYSLRTQADRYLALFERARS